MRTIWICVVCAVLVAPAGCSGTALSRQPSSAEIDAAVQRRLDAVEQIAGLSAEQKAQMKAHIKGGTSTQRESKSGGR